MTAALVAFSAGLFDPWLFDTVKGDSRLRCGCTVSMVAMTRTNQKALIKIIQTIGLRCNNNRGRSAITINLYRLRLGLRILLVVLVKFFGHFIDETLVMLGVLQIAFCQNAVTGGSCVARQGHIFLINLISRAADAYIGAVAVEGLNAGINTSAA